MVFLRNSFLVDTDSKVVSSSLRLCGGRTDGAATASYHIGRGTFDLGIYIYLFFENFFSVEGVESSPR